MAGNLYIVDVKRAANDQVWFRFRIEPVPPDTDGEPEIRIYIGVALQKTINGLGKRPAGTYASRSRAIFWDTKDTGGSPLAGGVYFADLYIDSVYEDRITFTLP